MGVAYECVLIRQIPRIAFAHRYSTERYDMRFARAERVLEITCLQQGDVRREYEGGGEELLRAPGLVTSFFDRAFSMRSEARPHGHVTVGLQLEMERRPLSPAQVVEYGRARYLRPAGGPPVAILPDHLAIDQHNADIERRMERLIHAHASPEDGRELRCLGMLFELLGEITEQCVQGAMAEGAPNLPPGGALYVRRAIQYISEHLEEKIAVPALCAQLGISCGHLSRLFKLVTGQTVVEYVNRVKLKRIKELLDNKRMTLREAGERVGLGDENYVSRIFRKYEGLSAREYRARQLPPVF